MKKWIFIAAAGLLAGCGVIATPERPYKVMMEDIGYSVTIDDKGVETYVIPQVKVQVTAGPGAKDMSDLSFKAVLLTGDDKPVFADDKGNVAADGFITGKLVGFMKGGYACTTTVDAQCTINSPDSYYAPRVLNVADVAPTARIPITWAVAHNHTAGSTSWHVRFDFTASNGGAPVNWSETYQIVAPAGSQ